MEPTMTRIAGDQVELFDEAGRLIGTILRPVTPEVLGPGAEKVYLARRPAGTVPEKKRPYPANPHVLHAA